MNARLGSVSNTLSAGITSLPAAASLVTAASQVARTDASTVAKPMVGHHNTRSGTARSPSAARQEPSGAGWEKMSVGSGPMTASRASATSAMRRAIGPFTVSTPEPGAFGPPTGTRPWEHLIPDNPHSAEGIRIEPPPSDPVPSGIIPAAIAAPVPPEDPPGEKARAHGFAVAPNRGLSVTPLWPCSGVVVLPITMHPAARRRATSTESVLAIGASAISGEPKVVRKPAASSRSFTPIGMPASGPTSAPRAIRASSAAACANAPSPSHDWNALIVGCSASMREMQWVTTSRADSSRRATRLARLATVSR